MKKINPRIISVAVILLSLLAAGGFAAKEAMAPASGGWEEELEPTGG